jgi:hypothetical protein
VSSCDVVSKLGVQELIGARTLGGRTGLWKFCCDCSKSKGKVYLVTKRKTRSMG